MSDSVLIAHCGAQKISRAELATLPVPASTDTFKPIPHSEVVNALVETLGFRHIGVVRDEYAATPDGMKMFGVMDLEAGFTGCRFSLGLRNANDKSMRLALTVGYRTFVCDNLAFHATLRPVWPSIPKISRFLTPSLSAWKGCRETSSRCDNR